MSDIKMPKIKSFKKKKKHYTGYREKLIAKNISKYEVQIF